MLMIGRPASSEGAVARTGVPAWKVAALGAALTCGAMFTLGPGAALADPPQDLAITHGIAAGDVTSDSAVIWSRASGPGNRPWAAIVS